MTDEYLEAVRNTARTAERAIIITMLDKALSQMSGESAECRRGANIMFFVASQRLGTEEKA